MQTAAKNNLVWIDMEASAYTDATLEIFRRASKEFGNVGVCLQSYLHRTSRDLDLGPNFNAEVGFAPRVDMRQHILRAGFGPRPKALGLR